MTQQEYKPGESQPGVTRRKVLQASAAAAAAPMLIVPRKSGAQVPPVLPPSPPTTPWVEELASQDTPITPLAALTPAPTVTANTAGGEIGRAPHQRYAEIIARTGKSPILYELTAAQNNAWVFNPAYPAQPVWGYQGNTTSAPVIPGPTFHMRYGQPVILRMHNQLPLDHVGFGSPEITTHLHNMHTPSESDGFTGDYYSRNRAGPTLSQAGEFHDHFYPCVYAGYDEYAATLPYGDPNEALGTLWYHDHTEGVTAPNVLRGLAGRCNIYDDLDTGDETTGLRLPSGPYDYPLTFGDRRFDESGRMTFDQLNPEGVLGDKVIVNGKIEPVLRVARRRYRFRMLNGGPTRFYEIALQNASANGLFTFTYIANDGNLLPNAIQNMTSIRFAPAERADIVVDFARFAPGTVLYMVNLLQQTTTRQPDRVVAPGTRVLKIIVGDAVADNSLPPRVLRPLRPLPPDIATRPVTRTWEFARSGGMWSVNNQFFDVFDARAMPVQGTGGEIWDLVNPDNGWQHPVHIHFEEGILLGKWIGATQVPIPAHERGRKDVYVLGPGMRIRVFLRFRDFLGKYLMHCHNLTHEDHAMMIRWDIVA